MFSSTMGGLLAMEDDLTGYHIAIGAFPSMFLRKR